MQLITFGFKLKTAQAIVEKLNKMIPNNDEKIHVYDAEAWVTDGFSKVKEESPTDKLIVREDSSRRLKFVRRALVEQPYLGIEHFESWFESQGEPCNVLIVEPQTPDEFISMIQSADATLVLKMAGQAKGSMYPDVLAEGKLWMEQYLLWRKRMGSEIPMLTCSERELEEELAAAATR